MRIVQFISRMDVLGGAQTHVRDLSIGLKREGHDVIVLSMGHGVIIDELSKHGIPCILLKNLILPIHPYYDMKALIELRRILKELQPDLLATHSSKAGVLGRIAGKSLEIPTIFTAHGWAFTEGVPEKKRKIYQLIEGKIARISPGIITVSKYDYQLALEKKVVPGDKMEIIHNGVLDIPSYLLSNPSIDPPRIIMVARFALPKDHLSLIHALNQLREFSWQLDLIGDGPLLSEVVKRVEELELTDKIHFWGDRRDVAERLADAQIAVLVTKLEGLPISIIEYFRSGLPVIASNVGGVAELVDNGVNGYLFARDDHETLGEKLKELLVNPELRSKMGEMARKKYEEYFSFEKMHTKTLDYYEEVIGKCGKGKQYHSEKWRGGNID